MTERVQSDSAVLVHFDLKLEDGTIAESTRRESKPALFRLGDDSLSPALEQLLLGLHVGDKKSFSLAPESAFGPVNPDLIQFFSRRDFIETGVPDVGTIMLFTAVSGNEMPGLIREVAEESITVDFNHPLAGRTVCFDIDVLAIDPQQEDKNAHLTG
ncbi:FKBP-type peptidyl-prolyl cis-trans isomerase [Acerihabitans arboris]|uniref:Peptidyl-prolyl cis-trans isomerase n=1 Tax=Acerihabitans arboris TaxID=2691583 RepID=A0A845SD63_9GAMM|nr:FKBP-type peptidyl-prolyl cis-trans isomerase [Acerihabitans arboris]NDL61332.1 FKBP-type peptidyl-prolyl cis-trans isomerase [Acerihabitans arboris]